MAIDMIDGVLIDAKTLDGTDLATLATEAEAEAIAVVYANELTRKHFIMNEATGTFSILSKNINDGGGVGGVGDYAKANATDQYAEVDFGAIYKIKQWRHYGHTVNVGDGTWKIEYYDGSWHDWVTGIPTRDTAYWSAWSEETAVFASKIRLVCTDVDSSTDSVINELQIAFAP